MLKKLICGYAVVISALVLCACYVKASGSASYQGTYNEGPTITDNGNLTVNGSITASNLVVTTIASHTISYVTITNMVYNGGATTGNVNIVKWQ